MSEAKELTFFDPNSCNLCNNGLIKEIHRLMQEENMSTRQASEALEAQIKEVAGDVAVYSAEAIRSRYKANTGTKRKDQPVDGPPPEPNKVDLFIESLGTIKPSEKNVLAAVCTYPDITIKEFRSTFSGNDNFVSVAKKMVAEFFEVENILALPTNHPVFHKVLGHLPEPKLKANKERPARDPKFLPKQKKKSKAPDLKESSMDLDQALKFVGLGIETRYIQKQTLFFIVDGYKAKFANKPNKLEKLNQANGILKALSKKR